MVEGFRNGNGQKPQLRVIRGGLDKKEPELAKLAKEVEPLVREELECVRKIADPKEKIGRLCLIAEVYAAVDGDSTAILDEAIEVANKFENKAFAAGLLVEMAVSCWISGLDPLPAIEKALGKAEGAPEGAERDDVLAGIAIFYAKMPDFGKAKEIMEKITDEGIRKETKEAIFPVASEET